MVFASVPFGQGLEQHFYIFLDLIWSGYHDLIVMLKNQYSVRLLLLQMRRAFNSEELIANLEQRQALDLNLPGIIVNIRHQLAIHYYICAYPHSMRTSGNGGLRMTDGTTVIAESNIKVLTRTEKAFTMFGKRCLTPTITIEGKSIIGSDYTLMDLVQLSY